MPQISRILAQLVRDEEDADSLTPGACARAGRRRAGLEGGEGGGGLVEDQHAGVAHEAAQDLDDLPLGDFQGGGLRVEVERDGELGVALLDPPALSARGEAARPRQMFSRTVWLGRICASCGTR